MVRITVATDEQDQDEPKQKKAAIALQPSGPGSAPAVPKALARELGIVAGRSLLPKRIVASKAEKQAAGTKTGNRADEEIEAVSVANAAVSPELVPQDGDGSKKPALQPEDSQLADDDGSEAEIP